MLLASVFYLMYRPFANVSSSAMLVNALEVISVVPRAHYLERYLQRLNGHTMFHSTSDINQYFGREKNTMSILCVIHMNERSQHCDI